MRFHKSTPILLSSVLCLLLSVKADDLLSQKCVRISTEIDCTESLNADLTDGTKCLPIFEATMIMNETNSESPYGRSNKAAVTCASWKDIQNNNFTINYQSNHEDIATVEVD